jgi:hypothetical protein
MKCNRLSGLAIVIITTLFSISLQAQDAWIKRGSDSLKYEMMNHGSEYNNKKVFTIRSVAADIKGFGTYMQKMPATNYIGKRIKMTGYMRTDELNDWAGFWMRVDQGTPPKILAFDNMQERSIQGTSEWNKYDIVLDVPANATAISYGAIVNGTGQVWFTHPEFEVVDQATPVTGNKGD